MTNGTYKIFYIFSAPAQETSVSEYAGSNDINIFIITKNKHRKAPKLQMSYKARADSCEKYWFSCDIH